MKKNLETTFLTRQYMVSHDFEIYYYNDRNFSNVSPHSHDYYEFYFFLEGDAELHVNDSVHLLQPGDAILIPPQVSHYIYVKNTTVPYRRFVLWVGRNYYDSLSEEYQYWYQQVIKHQMFIFHFSLTDFNALQAKVYNLIEELHAERFAREAQIRLYLMDLLLHLNRAVHESRHPYQTDRIPTLCQNLLYYIEDHLEEDLSLDILARRFFTSKYHIAHVFKDTLGLSIHQYILKKRLSRCREAILSGTDATQACLLWGFNDYSTFYRAFKKEYGLSPNELKRSLT